MSHLKLKLLQSQSAGRGGGLPSDFSLLVSLGSAPGQGGSRGQAGATSTTVQLCAHSLRLGVGALGVPRVLCLIVLR